MEPRTRTAVIILSNRVHPKDDGSAARLRATVDIGKTDAELQRVAVRVAELVNPHANRNF